MEYAYCANVTQNIASDAGRMIVVQVFKNKVEFQFLIFVCCTMQLAVDESLLLTHANKNPGMSP